MPLWEAMLGGHESVTKLLLENGADIAHGDVGHFSCTAVEKNKLDLLKEIIRYGGDITLPMSDGTTALHIAVSEDNVEMVRFLVDQGADIDKPDIHGWTPRDLADQQGHDDIKAIFPTDEIHEAHAIVSVPETHSQRVNHGSGRFRSQPKPRSDEGFVERPRRRKKDFHNSIFGLISTAQNTEKTVLDSVGRTGGSVRTRVTVSFPELGEVVGRLTVLPQSLSELFEIGVKKFGSMPTKVLSSERAEIDDLEVIKDGDHLIFVG